MKTVELGKFREELDTILNVLSELKKQVRETGSRLLV